MGSDSKIFVAGHKGLVGSAIVRHLEAEGFTNIITADRRQCDLTNLNAVKTLFMLEQPEYVFLAAAKVGGIGGNSDYPADFIYENLMIQSNVISVAAETGVEKLLFLGSSCIYPKFAKQPITEDQLLTGPLEGSNDAYAIAKITGIKEPVITGPARVFESEEECLHAILENQIKEGLFNNSIIPIGTLLSTRYFISLQLIGLIIVACVIGSIAVTKNTIENDNEGERETV